MFEASVSSFEDHHDISTGHAYTLYCIEVQAPSIDKRWTITKRYK
jgi:hypothetical protein